MDIVLDRPNEFSGFITQERIALSDVIHNRFGKYYA